MPFPAPLSARALAVLLTGAGVTHFASPEFYDAMVPSQLPGQPRMWTYGSGVVEFGVAATLAMPRTRQLGGLAAAALFVGVLPANVQMVVDARRKGSRSMLAVTLLRLPLQLPLIVGAWRVFRR